MKEKQIYYYYALGWEFHILCNMDKFNYSCGEMANTIKVFLNRLKLNNLTVSVMACQATSDDFVKKLEKHEHNAAIPPELATEIPAFMLKLEATIDAELKLKVAYELSEKKFKISTLLSSPPELFSENVYAELSVIAQYDFTEAGKCIAFERPTAAAFHILRGTEATLRQYYQTIIKRKRLENPLWGPMVTQLRQRTDTPKPMLDALDNIRANFRNPTLHPEATYGLDEAQDLLSVCVDAINRMVKDMRKRHEKSAAT